MGKRKTIKDKQRSQTHRHTVLLASIRLMQTNVLWLFGVNTPTVKFTRVTCINKSDPTIKLTWMMRSKIHTSFFEDTAALFALASTEDMYVGVLSNQSPASLLESGRVRHCQDGDGWCRPVFTQASQGPFRNLWVTSGWLCPLFVNFPLQSMS